MANQYKNKVVYGGNTLIDLSGDTVDPDKLLSGYTAHDKTGAPITGTYVAGQAAIAITTETLPGGGTAKHITGVDISNDTVDAAHLVSGYTAHTADGTAITGGIATKSSSDLTASGATVTAPAGYYASAASMSVASGTAGTPTATKGTVSNHSVSVTPSVTNTTGYISGGTKTGTAVTVSASELVSGNLAITENGDDIDCTNYSTVSVNVSGGSTGLVYETGTWEPSSDVNTYNISFSDTHTDLPVFVQMMDATGTYSDTTYSNYGMCIVDWGKLFGSPIYASSTSARYGSVLVYYRGTSTTSITSSVTANMVYPSSDTGSSHDGFFRYWVTESGFKAFTNSSNNYWRTGRTYKWIAVWAPES